MFCLSKFYQHISPPSKLYNEAPRYPFQYPYKLQQLPKFKKYKVLNKRITSFNKTQLKKNNNINKKHLEKWLTNQLKGKSEIAWSSQPIPSILRITILVLPAAKHPMNVMKTSLLILILDHTFRAATLIT